MQALGDAEPRPRSHVFQYTTIHTNEKKINLREREKKKSISEKGKRTWQSRGAGDFNAPKDPEKDI